MSDVLWPDDDLLIVSGGSPLSLIDGHCLTILDHDRKHTVQLSSHVKGKSLHNCITQVESTYMFMHMLCMALITEAEPT